MNVAAGLDLYVAHRDARRSALAVEPSWLTRARDTAFDTFVAEGFPTTRDEEWRFTNISAIVDTAFEPTSAAPTPAADTLARANGLTDLDAHRLVFVGGRFAPHLSSVGVLPAGVTVSALGSAVGHAAVESHFGHAVKMPQRAFSALNTALFADGALIHVAPGVTLDKPVHVLFVASADRPTASHPRVLVVADSHSRATVIESYVGAPGTVYFTNACTELIVKHGAHLEHYRLQMESDAAYHVAAQHAYLLRDAVCVSHNIVLGAAIARNDINATLDAQGINCTLNGLYVADGSRLVDNHTAIDHAKPHCESHELYKGVLAGHGRGVFNGKIFVRQDAQKTDAKQTNKVLLLSEDATINTKPQLEIFADDVKCTHGATVGQLDAQQLFYLQARGIGREAARAMLIQAFALDIIERIEIPQVRAAMEAALLRRLPR